MNAIWRGLIASCFVIASATMLFAQETAGTLHLSTQKPHPLQELLFALKAQYRWSLCYEEAPVLAAGELINKVAPTGMMMLTRRIFPMSVDLSSEQLSATGEARLAVINSLLNMYAKAGNSDSFRAIDDGAMIQIIPVSARGADGKTRPFDPILSTKISLSERHFADIYEFVNEVIGQVSQIRGIPIVLATVPTNLFHQSSVIEFANNEPAGQVLERAFAEINGPRVVKGLDFLMLTWDLLYDPTDRQYWFNVTAVKYDRPGLKPAPPVKQASQSTTRIPTATHRSS